MLTGKYNDEYRSKLFALRDKCKARLEEQGLYVEISNDGDEGISLSISLTKFGLSTMYATVTQEELEYFIDNKMEV